MLSHGVGFFFGEYALAGQDLDAENLAQAITGTSLVPPKRTPFAAEGGFDFGVFHSDIPNPCSSNAAFEPHAVEPLPLGLSALPRCSASSQK